jgi:glycosyltransferase involved in cell wall biosynthesis
MADLMAAADEARADLVLLHEPALAAARRDARPMVVICDWSHLVHWRQLHGDAKMPKPVASACALERLGLHAADRIIAPSRSLAAEIVALHGLALPPAIAPPVFRKPEAREKRSGDAGLLLAGATEADPRDVRRLDRAAAQVCGQILLFDTGASDPGQALCLEQMHRLSPLTAATAEALLLRAAAFYSPSCGANHERLVWRAASAGCAMILPDTKTHREFWQGAAHFVDPGSEQALAASLRRMLEDDDHRRKTAAAGLRRARALVGGPSLANLHKVLASALGPAPLTAAL